MSDSDYGTLEDVQAEIDRLEQERQAAINEEKAEKERIARREQLIRDNEQRILKLKLQAAQGAFNEAVEDNRQVAANNRQAVNDLQADIAKLASLIDKELRAIMTRQTVVRTYKEANNIAYEALNTLFIAKRDIEMANNPLWADHDENRIQLSLIDHREQFRKPLSLREAILEDVQDLPEETRRLYVAIANLLTGPA